MNILMIKIDTYLKYNNVIIEIIKDYLEELKDDSIKYIQKTLTNYMFLWYFLYDNF